MLNSTISKTRRCCPLFRALYVQQGATMAQRLGGSCRPFHHIAIFPVSPFRTSPHERLRFFGSTQETFSSIGKQVYEEALQAMERAAEVRDERERTKSEEMYKAWQRADEREQDFQAKKSPLKGVAIVKTIVKQTRKELKEGDSNPEQVWNDKADQLLHEAALEHGYPKALVHLANSKLAALNEATTSQSESLQNILALYQQAGERDSKEGWFNLGQLYWTGYPAMTDDCSDIDDTTLLLPPNQELALQAFQKAIDLGDADAMYFVGVQMSSLDKHRQGYELIQRAANHHQHGPALYYLALMHLNGEQSLDIPPSLQTFVSKLDMACHQQDPDALFLRGSCYHNGDHGYPQNYPKALDDFLLASDAGNADAAVSAGALLHTGRPGIYKDQTKAFQLYQHAGELGSVEGWRNVVACYAHGEGVPQSMHIAQHIAKTMLK